MILEHMLEQLADKLGSDAAIAKRLGKLGIPINQSSVWRMRNGSTAKYHVGKAVEQLYAEVFQPLDGSPRPASPPAHPASHPPHCPEVTP